MIKNSVKSFLPIGTVIMLKEGEKRLMIFGILQNAGTENETTAFDYIGVPYPEGNMGPDSQFLFQHEDIKEVYFRGFEDVERQEFIFNLEQYMNNLPDED